MGVLISTIALQAGADDLRRIERGYALNPVQPAPAGDDFLLVPGAANRRFVPAGRFPLAAQLLSYSSLSPPLNRWEKTSNAFVHLVSHHTILHPQLSGSPLPWLLLALDLPFTVWQNGELEGLRGFSQGDLSASARFSWLRSEHFALGSTFKLWLPTGAPAQLTGSAWPRAEPQLNASGRRGFFVYAVSAGVSLRRPLHSPSLDRSTAITFGAATGLSLFADRLLMAAELSGRSWLSSQRTSRFSSVASPILGVLSSTFKTGSLRLRAAGSWGLTDAPGMAPRLLLAIGYHPQRPAPVVERVAPPIHNLPATVLVEPPTPMGPPLPSPPLDVDSDGDGIGDRQDSCPYEPGAPHSSNFSQNGCPEPTRTADP